MYNTKLLKVGTVVTVGGDSRRLQAITGLRGTIQGVYQEDNVTRFPYWVITSNGAGAWCEEADFTEVVEPGERSPKDNARVFIVAFVIALIMMYGGCALYQHEINQAAISDRPDTLHIDTLHSEIK